MAARASWEVALRTVFIAQIVCGGLVFLTAVFLRDAPLPDKDEEDEEGDDEEEDSN